MIAATAIEIVTGRETVIESETRAGIGTGTVIATVIEIETVTVTEIGIGTRIGAGIVIESGTATVIGTGTGTGKETTRTGALVNTQRCCLFCACCA